MALFNTNQIELNRLANESVSVALVTHGRKTLHVVTVFYLDPEFDRMRAYTEYKITSDRSLVGFNNLEMAIDHYNKL